MKAFTILKYWTRKVIKIEDFSFLKQFLESFYWDHWYPCFGSLVMSPLGIVPTPMYLYYLHFPAWFPVWVPSTPMYLHSLHGVQFPVWFPAWFLAFTVCRSGYLCVILTQPDICIWIHLIGIVGSTLMRGGWHGWGWGEQRKSRQEVAGLNHGTKFDCCVFVTFFCFVMCVMICVFHDEYVCVLMCVIYIFIFILVNF